jgi:SpoIID/LytB domain protein
MADMTGRWRIRTFLVAPLLMCACHLDNGGTDRGGVQPPARNQPLSVPAPAPAAAPVADAGPYTPSPATGAGAGPPPAAAPGIRRAVPALDQEPRIGVLLESAPQLELTLLEAGSLEGRTRRIDLAPGVVSFSAVTGGLHSSATGSQNLGPDVIIHLRGPGATFSALLDQPFAKAVRLRLAGDAEIHLDHASHKALLVERVGMETYLAGVLASEVNPTWPLESLKAQAVVARSYAADRYLQNWQQSWQLHWHFTVDMAYSGSKPLPPRTAAALEQTRGVILQYQGLPVPALFHACSGGRTESALHFRPDLKGADGVTDMTVVMPSVDDPAAITGAEALGMSASHLAWHGEMSLAKISAGLQHWAGEHPQDREAFGEVESVRVLSRYPDSGRVMNVSIRHFNGRREVDSELSGADFRLAVGPGVIRSTDWTRCQLHGDTLVIEGRGYGHGVGMSQVSAYQLARDGGQVADILARFYPLATLAQRWR